MQQVLKILAVAASSEEALEIERVLKRAEITSHLEHITGSAALHDALSRASWDIAVLTDSAPLTSAQVTEILRQRALALPVLRFERDHPERFLVAVTRAVAIPARREDETPHQAPSAPARAADTFLESEERYRALLESTFDLICELDADGHCSYITPNFTQRFGYTVSELRNTPIFEHIHPDDADRVITKFSNTMSGRPNGPFEFRHAHKGGAWVWLEGTMRPLRAQEARRVVLISRDISERKRHESELASLISLGKAVNAQSDLSAIARELYEHLRGLMPFDSVSIYLLSGAELTLAAHAGTSLPSAAPAPIPASFTRESQPEHPAWRALDRGEVWMVNRWSAGETPETGSATRHALRAFIKVPLVAEGEAIGLLNFDAARPYVFTDDHARLAGMVGEQVAVAIRQVRQLEKTLRAENKYRTLVQDVEAIVWEADPATQSFTFVSPRAEAWLGFPLAAWLGDGDFWSARLHPDDRERVLRERRAAIADGRDYQLEYRVRTAEDQVLWLRDLGSVETRDGRATHLRGLMVDITSHKQYETAIARRNTILRAVQEAATDGICVMDAAETPVSFNRRFVEIWPIPTEMMDELRDKRQIMAYVASKMGEPSEFIRKISALHDTPGATTRDEMRLQDGRLFEVYSAPATTEDGESFGRVWSFRDVTERERYERQLTHQAFHDPLTDLPNRALFMDRLRHAIVRSNRVARLTGVLFLDLDRFKIVNDSLGHPVGDELLKQVAARIERSTRPNDTAARFGGDEFTVLVEDIADSSDTIHVASRILESLQAPFMLCGHEVHVTGSIGIALSTSPEDSADDLLRKADVAMYWSKNRGAGRYEVFDDKMSAQALERLQLEIDLRQAVKRSQLHLRYQPLVHLATGRIIGAEALLRWQHPTRGLVNPNDFIPIAEETGMILPIGAWVLREACAQARQWQEVFPHDPPLKISINLSARQLEQEDLLGEIQRILQETDLDARSLQLEITESVVMENVQSNIEQLEALRRLGVTLAIDDFGTGYSSLSYLEHFPLDMLKIDRAFVGQIGASNGKNGHNGKGHNGNNGHNGHGQNGHNGHGGDGLAILKAVSTLGQTLGVSVTAEGIETAEQRAQLTALSCEIGQGFHFAEPLEAAAVDTLLRHNSLL
jgi:diguanylate cyclase (GGDEF)-like protein/PAS domain S-box-containing protein